MRCLDEKMLERIATESSLDPELAEAEAHVESCRRCAEALDAIPAGDDLIMRIRELEQARNEIAPALKGWSDLEERLTTTLFGNQAGERR